MNIIISQDYTRIHVTTVDSLLTDTPNNGRLPNYGHCCMHQRYDVKSGMWNGMESGMDYGTYLVHHKHANYVATPIPLITTNG